MTVPQLLLALLVSLLYGSVSLVLVIQLGYAAQRAFGMQREVVMSLSAVLGIAVTVAANHYQIYWLGVVGGLLFAWIGLLVQGIAVALVWHSLRIVLASFKRLLRGNG